MGNLLESSYSCASFPWNQTNIDYPSNSCIHHVFQSQVGHQPDAVAVILPSSTESDEIHLSYRELNDRANCLAQQLQVLGVTTETFVAIAMDRSIELMVAILGVLKAGGVYVPLDPAYPTDRLAFMLEDSQAPVLLTQSHLRDRLPPTQAQIFCLDAGWGVDAPPNSQAPEVPIAAENLAYVNYTSGSTGRPKGVAIPHRAVLRLVFGATYTPLDGQQTFLQLAPVSFDAATLEIWGALLHGSRCVLYPENGLPDPQTLGQIIRDYRITTMWLTAALFNTIVTEAPETLQGVKELLTGGEALSVAHIRQAQTLLPDTQLINGYGPTESTTFTCCYRIPRPLDPAWTSIPIGTPIGNTQVYVLDDQMQPVAMGAVGELYIGGDGLARGYLNRPDLTTERFVPNPFQADPQAKLYKTGDLVRHLSDGNLEFIGRTDHQVKIRGYRIELGEIETVLSQQPGVRDAIVLVREDRPGDKQLVAYLTAQPQQILEIPTIRAALQNQLADYMVPGAIVILDKIPLTPNGKADRRALPKPERSTPVSSLVRAKNVTEQQLVELWSEILGLSQVSVDENFCDLGGTSLLGLQLVTRIQKQFNLDLRAVKLYQYPTIRSLAAYLVQLQQKSGSPWEHPLQRSPQGQRPSSLSTAVEGIAIVGMVGRFPGANSIAEFWQNLVNNVESTTFFSPDEIDPSVDPELRHDPNYVRARGTISGAEDFDAAFFGISPREAEVMDPQARVFLELAYEALETAGYHPDTYSGSIGLYAGSGQNTYFERHLCGRPEIIDRIGAFQTMLANEKDFVTTRIAYKLNLQGPSVSINTACSTSLVAVGQAVQGLLSHQCDLALAGGVSITTPQNTGYLYQEGSMLSPDGRCRPFDAEAQGTMFNSGAGIVVLKRLADALEAGDLIYAVIKGVGLNNDGSDKVSFTAPSVQGQARAIVQAQTMAGVNPESISYVETHGTATPLGDPIEVEALTQAFQRQTQRQQFCAIGSIKSNIGHAVAAAGVAGLMKTALALYHEQLPASLNFTAPNPQIDFAQSPFYVNAHNQAWLRSESPRRAGVSSFGVGGTNAHVIVEEAPIVPPSGPSRPVQLLLLSAKTPTALDRATDNLRDFLSQATELNLAVNLADVAYTLQQGRKGWKHRRFVIGRDVASAIAALTPSETQRPATRSPQPSPPEVVFMFPGQGSQYLHMGANLYQREPVFQATVDRCAAILQPLLGCDLRAILYPAEADAEMAAARLKQTLYTQPALFTIEYALAQLWISWGVQPAALIGHSIGEFVAACLAGVFSLEDGLKLVATRGQMMWELPPGTMLSVRLPAETVAPRLTADMAIAAINGPALCVVSGPTEAVAKLQAELEAEDVICKPLHTSHAFHSPMMEPVVAPFAELVKQIQLSPPQIPFVSTVTTDWIRDEQATDPLYWASHLRETVRFTEGVQTLWQQPERVLLEVGPRTTATTLARQQAKDLKRQIAIPSLGSSADDEGEWVSLMQAIGHLWLSGVAIDWAAFYTDEYRHRVPLPTYPFERQRYWIDPKPAVPVDSPAEIGPEPMLAAAEFGIDALPVVSLLSSPAVPPEVISTMAEPRVKRLIPLLQEVFEETSGFELDSEDLTSTFLDLGMDSLTLTQVALAVQKKFKVKLTFRNLLEDYPNLARLSEHLDRFLSVDAFPAPTTVEEPTPTPTLAPAVPSAPVMVPGLPITSFAPVVNPSNGNGNGNGHGNGNGSYSPSAATSPEQTRAIEAVIAQQLQIMAQQLHILNGVGSAGAIAQPPVSNGPVTNGPVTNGAISSPLGITNGASHDSGKNATNGRTNGSPNGTSNGHVNAVLPQAATQGSANGQDAAAETAPPKKNFGPGAKIEKTSHHTLTAEQQAALDRIIQRYVRRTVESKRQTQEHRRYLADPRTVSGFMPLLKEIVYPIVTDRSKGSKLWDVDGNEYIDLTNGFGLNFFGWSPDFVADAVKAQMDAGIEIGPQTPLAGRVAKMVTEITGMERVAFCNTGSEAVMAAMRLSRTVTGRSTIAMFAGGYHGTFDEVIVRSGPKLRSLPAAPGILPSMFENVLVLDYGTPESLQILRDRADDLAAILVEPVQSRRPELQPREFLKDLRVLTEASETALIFDEVVTGFRVHPGGAQAYFDIRADLATYGKVIGGGLPIGVVAGKSQFMDALDGGQWQFGDASFPEVGVTFFAGTFVRHPMALAAAEVVLQRLQAAGPSLQQGLAAKVDRFATHLQQYCDRVQAPIKIAHFSSFFYVTYAPEATYGSLLFYLLRERGVHIWEHRPCFFTLAHTDEEIEFVTRAFKDSIAELQAAGLLPGTTGVQGDRNQPPQPGARLGRDPQGNPAWFVPDPERPGKYLQLQGV
ncbi:polyketide synthase [Alkalinema sp. FACHB-956]|uniref:polyketide synthase n=1 Tax=Alkalinema sp. FACHB-956 TaxID=2692768 RepID=UPI001686FA65|nr:polyketide synthase [Alkalinema sp. FACHB-956]MBD2329075.1 amino acid adenylation domain-containing protein [Alkalinema sp. FACHB-956]